MKKIITVLLLFTGAAISSPAQVAINTDGSQPDSKAMLDVKSTTKGFLPPRMTQAQMNAIVSPPDGLQVYCTDCSTGGCLSVFFAGTWNCYDQNIINKSPLAQNVTQAPSSLNYGSTLTGSWTYFDCEAEPAGTSTYQWYRADDISGTNETVIAGATSITYSTTLADGNKYVRFAVTPVATTGTSPGKLTKASSYSKVNVVNALPVATNVQISGGYPLPAGYWRSQFAKVGDVLTGTYTYSDADADPEGASSYQWYQDTDSVTGGETAISSATSVNYTVTISDCGKYLKFGVTPAAATGSSPGTLVKSTLYPNYYRFVNSVPRANNVELGGFYYSYATLTSDFNYVDNDNPPDQEGTALYQWYRAYNVLGQGETAISGATASTYTIPTTDEGYFIRVGVTPVALTGSSPGAQVKSAFSAPIGAGALTCGGTYNYSNTVTEAGYTWLDRNLGASRVALSSTDHQSYGSLYQWGRQGDGHQCVSWFGGTGGAQMSGTTTTQCNSGSCSNSLFVIGSVDWNTPTSNVLWNGTTKGTNDPCPAGFRVPTMTELTNLKAAFSTPDAAGAFASALKLTTMGYLNYDNAVINYAGATGVYWSSTYFNSSSTYSLLFNGTVSIINEGPRAYGYAVRCIAE